MTLTFLVLLVMIFSDIIDAVSVKNDVTGAIELCMV